MSLARALGFAVAVLRISPRDFWELGLNEFLAIAAALAPPPVAPRRRDLAGLMRRFPDE